MGIDHAQSVAYYAGKREQERLLTAGPLPWSIVRATQFHDFAAMVAGWAEQDGIATIAPLLVRPIAPADVAAVLAEIATGPPLGTKLEIAGPETQDLVDMARRTFIVRGQQMKLVPTWRGIFGPDMAGEVLLPGEGAGWLPPHSMTGLPLAPGDTGPTVSALARRDERSAAFGRRLADAGMGLLGQAQKRFWRWRYASTGPPAADRRCGPATGRANLPGSGREGTASSPGAPLSAADRR